MNDPEKWDIDNASNMNALDTSDVAISRLQDIVSSLKFSQKGPKAIRSLEHLPTLVSHLKQMIKSPDSMHVSAEVGLTLPRFSALGVLYSKASKITMGLAPSLTTVCLIGALTNSIANIDADISEYPEDEMELKALCQLFYTWRSTLWCFLMNDIEHSSKSEMSSLDVPQRTFSDGIRLESVYIKPQGRSRKRKNNREKKSPIRNQFKSVSWSEANAYVFSTQRLDMTSSKPELLVLSKNGSIRMVGNSSPKQNAMSLLISSISFFIDNHA
jgi:hypothetical protein